MASPMSVLVVRFSGAGNSLITPGSSSVYLLTWTNISILTANGEDTPSWLTPVCPTMPTYQNSNTNESSSTLDVIFPVVC